MRKLILCLAMLVSTLTVLADVVLIDGLYYNLGNTTAQVAPDPESGRPTYSAYTTVTIPASVYYNNYTYPVTTLAQSAFEGCSNLQAVTLPNSITSINQDAFYGCSKLGSINLPEGLTTISQRAFYNCNLSSITIPSTVTSMGKNVFYGNPLQTITWNAVRCEFSSSEYAPFYNATSQVTSFTFGNQVQLVPQYVCYGMNLLDTIVLPASVSSLGTYAFAFCTSLKSINLPATQKTLPASIFEGCSGLESIELPATLTTINQDAFYGCSSLKNVNLHEGITTISQRAFYNCKLDSVTIPSTVNSMGKNVFYGNPLKTIIWNAVRCEFSSSEYAPFNNATSQVTSFTFGNQVQLVPQYVCYGMNLLDTIVLPASVTSLGTYAFAFCTSLKSINLPATQKTLPTSIFEGCSGLESIELPATLTTINQDAFYGCSKLGSINLPEGLTTIYQRAFQNCKLESVSIPSTVASIGSSAFKDNPTKSVTWLPANCSISTGDNAPFYSTSSKITSFVFGDSVKTIPGYLCYQMNKLDSVVLPASVTSIGTYAFAFCTALKNFEFPKGIKTVATSVLEGCTGLEDVIIPASVSTINQDAFYNCSKLMAIHNYAITPQSLQSRAVYNVNKQTCILYVPIDYINLYQTADVWKEFTNIIGVATDLQFEDQIINLTYLKADSTLHYMESQTWTVPHEPYIAGFTFEGWQVLPGMLSDGIRLRAVYTSNMPTQAPEVYINPANPTQKLIRNGNVYILRDDKIYTIQGQTVK